MEPQWAEMYKSAVYHAYYFGVKHCYCL